jgi:hypothetical protein
MKLEDEGQESGYVDVYQNPVYAIISMFIGLFFVYMALYAGTQDLFYGDSREDRLVTSLKAKYPNIQDYRNKRTLMKHAFLYHTHCIILGGLFLSLAILSIHYGSK